MASDGAAIHHRSRPRLSPPQRGGGRSSKAGKGASCSCSLSATVAVVAVAAAAAAAVEYYEKHFYELQMKKENGVGWE